MEDAKASIPRNGTVITSIVMNITDYSQVKMVLTSIGVYRKLGFRENNNPNLKRMQDTRYMELLKSPWEVARHNKEHWYQFDFSKVGKIRE